MLANGRIFLGERDKILFGIRVEERVLFLSTLFRSSFRSSIEPVLRIVFKHHEDGFNKDLAKGQQDLYACRRLDIVFTLPLETFAMSAMSAMACAPSDADGSDASATSLRVMLDGQQYKILLMNIKFCLLLMR